MSLFVAKPTFGNLQYDLSASDYLIIKKQRILGNKRFINKFNTKNLIYNLYSKENLLYVNTLSNNVGQTNPYINISLKPFYKYYNIDPKGELFGNSTCGINNFTKYMEPDCI